MTSLNEGWTTLDLSKTDASHLRPLTSSKTGLTETTKSHMIGTTETSPTTGQKTVPGSLWIRHLTSPSATGPSGIEMVLIDGDQSRTGVGRWNLPCRYTFAPGTSCTIAYKVGEEGQGTVLRFSSDGSLMYAQTGHKGSKDERLGVVEFEVGGLLGQGEMTRDEGYLRGNHLPAGGKIEDWDTVLTGMVRTSPATK